MVRKQPKPIALSAICEALPGINTAANLYRSSVATATRMLEADETRQNPAKVLAIAEILREATEQFEAAVRPETGP